MERLCCVPVRMVANLTLGSGLQNKIPIKQKSLVLTPHGASAASPSDTHLFEIVLTPLSADLCYRQVGTRPSLIVRYSLSNRSCSALGFGVLPWSSRPD